ncbi:MAG: LysR family transcriptional regulator [Sphingobacteriia bacterium]|nr:LysR family transcriptional regulator [Sphingobacteriia bacterium]
MFFSESKLIHFISFIKIVEKGSFVEAAHDLNISPSSLTKFIKELEHNYKFKLFVRTTRSIKVTEEGSIFYNKIKEIIDKFYEFEAEFSENVLELRGNLKVFSSISFAKIFIIPAIEEYNKLYPNVKVELEINDDVTKFKHHKYDIVYGLQGIYENNYIQKKLFETSYVICASKKYFNDNGKPTNLEDLKNHTLITHKNRPNEFNERFFAKQRINVNDSEIMLDLALKSIGIIIIHKYLIQNYLNSWQLIEVELEDISLNPINIYSFHQKFDFHNRKQLKFMEIVEKNVKTFLPY